MIKQQLQVEWQLLDAQQRRSLALDILKQVPCLLIWDNFEPVAGFPAGTPSIWTEAEQQELKAFLQDLRGGATRVLLTSRREELWLGNLYRLVEISGLNLTEAQELALRVLRRSLSSDQIQALPDYNALLRYLHGNPLAIQTILPELKRTNPDALLQSLQSGEARLSREDEQLGREHSLFASLTYRLDALDLRLHQRLGVLWLFQGFVDADVLAWMCQENAELPELLQGLQVEEWQGILDAASELGLLRKVGEGYYTVHPALPWFFHDIAQEVFAAQQSQLEQIFVAVYDGYGGWLHQTFNTNAEFAMQLLQLEESNLLHALRLGRQHQQWDRLPGMLYGLNRLWKTQGRWEEWERLLTELGKLAQDEAGEALVGRKFLWLCLMGHKQELAGFRRDFDAQEAILSRLREYYEKAGDEKNHAVSLHQLGMIAQERRDFGEAERWYRQSLSIKERIGNEHGQAGTLHQLGRIAEDQGQWDEAARFYAGAEAIFVRVNDEYSLNIVRSSIQRMQASRGGA